MGGELARIAAVIALALALAIFGELLTRLRRAEPARPWWFGYARDGVNLSAALMLWGAYLLLGLPPATALLAGMLTTLATYLLDWTIARGLKLGRARLFLAVPLLAWVAWVALAPGSFARLFGVLLSLGRPT
jgi:hypothetical protein